MSIQETALQNFCAKKKILILHDFVKYLIDIANHHTPILLPLQGIIVEGYKYFSYLTDQ